MNVVNETIFTQLNLLPSCGKTTLYTFPSPSEYFHPLSKLRKEGRR
jgi:hypothetical protein